MKRKAGKSEPRAERPAKKTKAIPSVFREEEPAFPRGGAHVLTPLEQKQIQVEAKQDVLFEQSTGQKALRYGSDGEPEEDEGAPRPASRSRKALHKLTSAAGKPRAKKLIEDRGVRIEGLSYKVDRSLPVSESIYSANSSSGYCPDQWC